MAVDEKIISQLSPLSNLTPSSLTELAKKSNISQYPENYTIFKQDTDDSNYHYLINGEVSISLDNLDLGKVIHNSDTALNPLDSKQPHATTCKTTKICKILSIDMNLLEILLDAGEPSSILAFQDDTEIDWMTKLFQMPLFNWVPAANLQQILMRMTSIRVLKNQVIFKQGETSDYFYAVETGACKVLRKNKDETNDSAELGPGNIFGEGGLLTNDKRNAAVVALQNGSIMRLSKVDFMTLIVDPIVRFQAKNDCLELIKKGSVWLDVRDASEFKQGNIPKSINVPLVELYHSVIQLDLDKIYVVYSNTEKRARSAIFTLLKHGIEAIGLAGGVSQLSRKGHSNKSKPQVSKKAQARQEQKLLEQAKQEQKKIEEEADRLQQQEQDHKEEAKKLKEEAQKRLHEQEEAAKKAVEEAYGELQSEFHDLNQELFQVNQDFFQAKNIIQGYNRLHFEKRALLNAFSTIAELTAKTSQIDTSDIAQAEKIQDNILMHFEQLINTYKDKQAVEKQPDVIRELMWIVDLLQVVEKIIIPEAE